MTCASGLLVTGGGVGSGVGPGVAWADAFSFAASASGLSAGVSPLSPPRLQEENEIAQAASSTLTAGEKKKAGNFTTRTLQQSRAVESAMLEKTAVASPCPCPSSGRLRNHPDGVDDSGNVAEQGQQNVDPEMLADPDLQKDTERRNEDGDENTKEVHTPPYRRAGRSRLCG